MHSGGSGCKSAGGRSTGQERSSRKEFKKISNAEDTGQLGAERPPGSQEWVPPPRDTIWRHLTKLDTCVPSDPAIPLLDAEHRETPRPVLPPIHTRCFQINLEATSLSVLRTAENRPCWVQSQLLPLSLLGLLLPVTDPSHVYAGGTGASQVLIFLQPP